MFTQYLSGVIEMLPLFFKGLWVTIEVSVLSILAGTVLGFCFGILRATRIAAIKLILACYVDIVRGTPFLVQVFIIFFILPEFGIHLDSFTASLISLTIYGAAYIGEIVFGAIDAIPPGQNEAAISTGLNWFQRMRCILVPQAMRPIIPPLVGQYVLLVKDTSVVSVIGLTDVTRVGWLTVQRIPEGLIIFGLVGLLYFCVCYPMIYLSNWFEKRLTVEDVHL